MFYRDCTVPDSLEKPLTDSVFVAAFILFMLNFYLFYPINQIMSRDCGKIAEFGGGAERLYGFGWGVGWRIYETDGKTLQKGSKNDIINSGVKIAVENYLSCCYEKQAIIFYQERLRWVNVMVYLNKISSSSSVIVYNYGVSKDSVAGKIEIIIDSSGQIDPCNIKLSFYENAIFDRTTSSALQGIAKFIRENYFPDEYVWAAS